MLNALTVDVEEYFHVHAFSRSVRISDWVHFESRIERNTERLLEVLHASAHAQSAVNSKTATFFVLGWIAERYPALVRRIREEGHEIACHGYAHQRIHHQSPKEFRDNVRRAKDLLESIIGEEVIGYRAPTYSITRETMWALDILGEEGFGYDSSIFPIHHDVYGIPSAPRFPFTVYRNGHEELEFAPLGSGTPPTLIEFPITTLRIMGQNIPVSGGGYFRLFPYRFIEQALMRINRKEKMPFMFYIHPWELDGDQPRIRNAPSRSTFRHYVNLNKTEGRLKRLLQRFDFSSVREILDNLTRRDESV